MKVLNPNLIIERLENELEILKTESIEKQILAEKSVGICQLAFLELKRYATEKGFTDIEDEILFFKSTKPKVFSKLIFYNELLRIETYRPLIHRKLMMKMLKNEINRIDEFIESNREFYQYYSTSQTCMDESYFVRNNSNVFINSKSLYYLTDPLFSTLKDETVSYILAYEQFGKYLENELCNLKRNNNSGQTIQVRNSKPKISWTASKAALVELVYALHSANCINNGRIDIKELIGRFELLFDVSLDKSYRVFVDIKGRQNEKAKFLIELKRAFMNRLNDLDALN